MMPVYRYMDSYPDQRNQISSGQNYYPSFEAVSPLTKVDPSKTLVMNQPWPYPNSFSHSVPYYPFSSDGHFPGYYSHGFYPHSPAPQFHCCAHHPPFPGAFPVQYVPPPCYLKELPRYDYDKPRDHGYHCCGCPNHSHYQKYGGGERIEEEEPKAGSKSGHSKVPFQMENYPYPVLWIPPEYMKNEEQKKPLESEGVTRENSSRDMKPPQNVKSYEQEPKERHSWFPLDMKSLQSLLQGDNGRRTQDQQDEERMQQFPFPIIWMPPHHKQKEAEKEEQGNMNGCPTIIKDPVPSNNVPLVKLLNNGHGMSKAREVHENDSDKVNSEPKEKGTTQRDIPVRQMEEKSTHQRSIPVIQMEENNTGQRSIPAKQMEVLKEGGNYEGAERRGRTISPKKRENYETDKSSGAGARRASSSPPKSKLPPVCLRVDPLPRKKSSGMSSRSPSPPGSTAKSQEKTKEALNLPVMSDHKAQTYQDSEARQNTLSSSKEAEEKQSKVSAIQVADRKRDENKDEALRNDSDTGTPVCSLVDSSDQTIQKSEKNDVKSIAEGDKGSESFDGSIINQASEKQEKNDKNSFVDAAIEGEKKKLSVDEAACCIQSAYRGYQVRKWEPLKKLKQIAEVQEQMIELRKKVHDFESSLDFQEDEKQTAVIGEMIMRLLLKLDTIQDLHPSLRNVRKSLARELVMLQEKLDLLVKTNSNEKPSDSDEGKSSNATEQSIEGMLQSVNVVSKIQEEETSKPSLAVEDGQWETVNDVQLVPTDLELPSNESKGESVGELDSITVLEQDQAGNEKTCQLPSDKSGSEEMFGAQLESICCDQDGEGQSKLSVANGSPHLDNYSQVSELEDKQAVISNDGRQNNEADSNVSQVSSSAAVDESDTAAQAAELLKELPVGVIENEEPLQHEQAGLLEDVLLLDGDVGENAAIDGSECQFTKDTSSELQEVSDLNEAKHQTMSVLDAKPTGPCTSSVDAEDPNLDHSEQEVVQESEVAPVVASMDPVKVQTADVLGKAMLGGGQQQTQALELSNIVQVDESLQEETHDASPLLLEKEGDNEMQKDEDQEIITLDVSCISEAEAEADNVIASNPEEVETGQEQETVYHLAGGHINERTLQEQSEPREQETVDVSDKSSYQLDKPDTLNEEGKRESLPLLTATELSTRESDGKNLVEENEKMREMVEKLVACGREQLAAISNLTGRVNDLEMKLRRKKIKARRCTPSTKQLPKKKSVSSAC